MALSTDGITVELNGRGDYILVRTACVSGRLNQVEKERLRALRSNDLLDGALVQAEKKKC